MCAAKGQLMSEVVRALLERELAAADAATAPKIKPVKKPGRAASIFPAQRRLLSSSSVSLFVTGRR